MEIDRFQHDYPGVKAKREPVTIINDEGRKITLIDVTDCRHPDFGTTLVVTPADQPLATDLETIAVLAVHSNLQTQS